jgi:hypothetical protein
MMSNLPNQAPFTRLNCAIVGGADSLPCASFWADLHDRFDDNRVDLLDLLRRAILHLPFRHLLISHHLYLLSLCDILLQRLSAFVEGHDRRPDRLLVLGAAREGESCYDFLAAILASKR